MGQKRKNQTRSTSKHSLKQRWYIFVPIFAVLVIIGFKVVQHGIEEQRNEQQTKKDIALLDDAEAKMRALPLPKAEHREYVRRCSVRSVKFTDPGPPNCGVAMNSIYKLGTQDNFRQTLDVYFSTVKKAYSSTKIRHKVLDGEGAYAVDNIEMVGGLSCYLNSALDSAGDSSSNGAGASYLSIYMSCYKRFKKQVYPELP